MSSLASSGRILPDWLKSKCSTTECFVSIEKLQIDEKSIKIATDKENQIEDVKILSRKSDLAIELPAKRYRTRLSTQNTLAVTQVDQVKKNASTQPRPKLSFIEYKGKVDYYTQFVDIAMVSDSLLTWVNNQKTDEMIPIAFDMEWPFTFQTGPGRTAVIQLCADIDLCYVFHIAELKKLPTALVQLLTHDKVLLHGVNVKNDCRKLERDFPEINSQKMVDQCIDLGVYCNKIMNTGGRWSMERLVWYLLRLKINKDKKVRNSKWHIMPLSHEQQIYAAIDVYISQVMYIKLKKTEIEKEAEARKFIEEFGEEAFKETQKLL